MKLRTRNIISWAFGSGTGYFTFQAVRYLQPSGRGWCSVSVCGLDVTPLIAGAVGALAGALWAWYSLE